LIIKNIALSKTIHVIISLTSILSIHFVLEMIT